MVSFTHKFFFLWDCCYEVPRRRSH